jgi:hypothetical protein
MNRFIAVMAIAVTALVFVVPAWAQVVSAVTLTNGPPNIPNASPCTPTTCAWIGAGWPSGTHVSLVYADLIPISANYRGTFSLSDQPSHTGDSSRFSISTASDGTRNVGEIKTSGTVAAGDYFVTVTAGGASGANTQNVTVHAVSGTNVACGGSIPTSGTVLLSPNCTYTQASWTPSPNTIYIGAGNGGTIIDGGASASVVFGNIPNVTLIGMQFQNYAGSGTMLGGTGDNNIIRNSRFVNNAGVAAVVFVGGGGYAMNNYVNNIGYAGLKVQTSPNPNSTALTTLIGNEVANTNTDNADPCNDVSASKIIPGTVLVSNSYYHDNPANDVWPDTNNSTTTISNNTFVRTGLAGTQIEQSRNGTTVDHNVYVHVGDGSTRTNLSPGCGGESQQGPTLWVQGSANVNAHDNNMSIYTVFDPILGANKSGDAWFFYDETGNGTGFVGNNTAHDNTVNFFTSDSSAQWGWVTSSEDTSGSSSNNNHFHLIGGNTSTDAHWFWFNQGNTAQTFANYRSSGQDANSTIDTTDTSTPGCTHVACSGSGIGAGGVPLTGPTALSIQGMALANSTFTPNVANGAVGTVSVTMSDGSAFSGKLSITGANSGGFQLSGNSLQEKASGTPAGTYHDFNVVAAQSTASNSPQQISPTVTGVVEAPFGGTVRSMTNRIQAEDFDVGGYGVAYHATDACGIGIDTAYGSDRLNVYLTADVDGASNLKIGCNQAGDWHNYTITAATTGTHTLNLRVANIEAGATYHVAIDGATVVKGIAVPNTGGYDTFATVTSKQFGLTAGQHVMQIALDAAGPSGFGGEFNWMQGTLVKAGAIGTKNLDINVTH